MLSLAFVLNLCLLFFVIFVGQLFICRFVTTSHVSVRSTTGRLALLADGAAGWRCRPEAGGQPGPVSHPADPADHAHLQRVSPHPTVAQSLVHFAIQGEKQEVGKESSLQLCKCNCFISTTLWIISELHLYFLDR